MAKNIKLYFLEDAFTVKGSDEIKYGRIWKTKWKTAIWSTLTMLEIKNIWDVVIWCTSLCCSPRSHQSDFGCVLLTWKCQKGETSLGDISTCRQCVWGERGKKEQMKEKGRQTRRQFYFCFWSGFSDLSLSYSFSPCLHIPPEFTSSCFSPHFICLEFEGKFLHFSHMSFLLPSHEVIPSNHHQPKSLFTLLRVYFCILTVLLIMMPLVSKSHLFNFRWPKEICKT